MAPILILESTALGGGLDNDAGLITGEVPAGLGQLFSLLFIDGQAGTGQGELDQEHQEQDDHVKEKQHLMVSTCSYKSY